MDDGERTCPVCGRTLPASELLPGSLVRPGVRALLVREHPAWTEEQEVCRDDLTRYRAAYVRSVLEEDRGELDRLESQVVSAIQAEDLVSENPDDAFRETLTVGQRVADVVAAFGGSWAFLVGFFAVLALWVVLNVGVLLARPFDPYPFILLNLLLSMLAAVQAPVIMMSQNRLEAKDRLRAENDFRTNLKAELEIRMLHEKVDHLLLHQWQRLLEIQQLQVDLIEELRARPR